MNRRNLLKTIGGIAIVGFAGCTAEEEKNVAGGTAGGDEETTEQENVWDGVKVLSHEPVKTEYGGVRVEGQVKNLNDETVEMVSVDVQFLDGGGNVLSNSMDVISDLGAGQTWNFEVPFMEIDTQPEQYNLSLDVTNY